ncbi:MAG: hypothetical protein EPN21_18985 [Methylococcaceae bacterium]|nr:MAG: hypothetical protein EPN21_18985 [Methylococcaceae bacterium]
MKESEYSNYVKAFTRLFEAYDAVEPYLDIGDDFKYFISRKRNWLERLKSPEFPVAFLGAFSAGKSTIINAVLGDDILPQATKSFTAIPTLIRKGAANRAVIHYLGQGEREELRGLYVEELSKELRKPADVYLKLEKTELLKRLGHDIEQHRSQYGSFNKQKFFDELKELIEGWNKLIGAVKEVPLAELSSYVTEDYSDVLFVDKAELYLAGVNIPENVVLVDLPGLGVVNPRHRKVTKSYVENDAKAFVIAMKVFHLLEGEEIELLAEIHSQRKRVLQRAFWVINQWDVLSIQHKKEELANFEDKINHYGFHIAKDRVFRVSALNYLLLKLIQDGKLEKSGKIREHVDALQKAIGKIPERAEAESYIKSLEEAKSFALFRTHLFEYLTNTAKAEFLDEARSEYLDLAGRLREKLEPMYQMYKNKNDDGMKNSFIAGELSKRQDDIVRFLCDTVEDHIMHLRTEILPEFEFWREEDQTHLAEQIVQTIDGVDRKSLRNQLLKGLDSHSVISRLPHKIEENLRIQSTFRDQLQRLLDEQIVRQYLRQLLDAISQVDALPEDLMAGLRDKLSGRDMLNRLKGMCDVFLFDYGNIIDELGRAIMTNLSSGDSRHEQDIVDLVQKNADAALEVAKSLHLIGPNDSVKHMLSLGLDKLTKVYGQLAGAKAALAAPRKVSDIDYALDYYKTGLLDYTRKQQEQINKYARRGIKNYFEELEEDLLDFFDAKKGDIAKVIMKRLTSDIDNELGAELEKQRVIKEVYQVVTQRMA